MTRKNSKNINANKKNKYHSSVRAKRRWKVDQNFWDQLTEVTEAITGIMIMIAAFNNKVGISNNKEFNMMVKYGATHRKPQRKHAHKFQ